MKNLDDFADWLAGLGPGEFSLTAYKKDGMCWSKRGEFPVTRDLLKALHVSVDEPVPPMCPVCKNTHEPACSSGSQSGSVTGDKHGV